MHMNEMNLRRMDLNLLVALDVLLAHEEVGLAAEKMGISPSAMSHTLNRLREAFGDKLLIKGKGRMIKTPRAEALAEPLKKALLELQHAIRTEMGFEPQSCQSTFNIATNDYGDLILLPGLLSLTQREAPGASINASYFDPENSTTPLETGAVELALCHPLSKAAGIYQQVLFDDHFYCAIRQDHPGVNQMDLETYLSLPHLQIAPRGETEGPVERALAKLGHQRRVALQMLNFNSAPMVLAQSDLVLTAPRRCIDEWAKIMPLSVFPCPFEMPSFSIAMLWHERFQSHPAHQWLRDRVRILSQG